jgi:O-antigen biosynthesis protein
VDSAEQVSSVGAIDVLTLHEVAGWAWDPRNPDESVIVEILDGDRVLFEVLADRPRADLAAIGLGNGRHGFAVKPLDDFLPMSRHLVRVRRKLDGADLPGNPGWLIRDRGTFDPAAIDFLEAAMERSLVDVRSPDDLGPPTAILLGLLNRVINRQMSMSVDKDSHARSLSDQAYQSGASDWMLDLLGRLQNDYPPLHFEVSEASPEVSVIIPVFNKFSYTYNCIKSIYDNPPECPFEIILVDDFSTDETMLCSLVLSGAVKIVRNEKNLNFIRTCNRGAAEAKGRFLFFLNNDTLVKPGWLDELLRTFSANPNVGIAGSKLLFEDGSLQEAGGIIWRMGDGWNWGRGRDPHEPAFCYLRDVDWVSGAALMIPKVLFDELGGFDEHYVPAYYEDTDLAFRARAAGKRTVVQPASEIVHLEGISNGKDVAGTGTKRFQAVNHRKFFTRWKDVLLSHRLNGEQPELEAERTVKLRAYFIDESVPTPDRDAGSNAALQHMIALMELGYKVTFLPSDNMAKISPYTEQLQKLGIECLYHPFYWSVEEVFRKAKVQPDLVYLHRYANATKYATMVRRYFPKCRILYSVADIHFLRIERQAELENSDELRRYAAEIRTAELAAMRQVDSVIVHSTYEADLLKQIEANLRVTVVP